MTDPLFSTKSSAVLTLKATLGEERKRQRYDKGVIIVAEWQSPFLYSFVYLNSFYYIFPNVFFMAHVEDVFGKQKIGNAHDLKP